MKKKTRCEPSITDTVVHAGEIGFAGNTREQGAVPHPKQVEEKGKDEGRCCRD